MADIDKSSTLKAVGIDLGGTKIRAARVVDGKLDSDAVQISTPKGASEIIESLIELIERFKDDDLAGAGIATAGVVDCNTGDVVGSTGNLPGWAGTKIKQIIEDKTGLPIYVENDANAAAYGESKIDELKGLDSVVVVTLGTGIGGGIVLGGKLHHGKGWAAGEIGHIRISLDDERLCTCGLYGCWEAYGSGRGLEATAREFLDGVDKNKSTLVENIDRLDTYRVFEASKKGDLLAQKIVHRWHEHIAVGVVNLTHILNPDCFVITGGLSEICDITLLKEMVIDRTLHNIGESVEIRPSSLGSDAGLIGAARCVVDKVLDCERLSTKV